MEGNAASSRTDRARIAALRAATRVLVEAPQSSLADVAEAIGIGRTTLHRMFPTRRDLIAAVAHDAIDHLIGVYADAGLGDERVTDADPMGALHRLVAGLIPLGPSLIFLLRATELDDDEEIAARIEDLDRPARDAVARAQLRGELDPGVPDWWAIETLFAGVYVAWEQIDRGRLAPIDAPGLVVHTWVGGVGA